jgi:hypothetical protein
MTRENFLCLSNAKTSRMYSLLALILLIFSLSVFKLQAGQSVPAHIPHVRNRLPFGIDRIGELLFATYEHRFLELINSTVQRTGTTLAQNLLGCYSIGTMEPENIAAMLGFQAHGNVV